MPRGMLRVLFGCALLVAGCGEAPPAGSTTVSPAATAEVESSPVGLLPSPSRHSPGPSTHSPSPAGKSAGDGALLRGTGSHSVALTFDDGPHPRWTPKVLDALHARGVKATFCVLGKYAKAYPELVRRIVAEGHTICNHSWGHEYRLGSWTPGRIRANLERTNEAIRAAAPDAQVTYFRQPGGKWTQKVMRAAHDLGMRPLHWSVDPWDWDRPGTKKIINRVIKNTRAGAVVLLHDGGGDRAQTVAALTPIISALRKGGHRLAAMPAPTPPKSPPSPDLGIP